MLVLILGVCETHRVFNDIDRTVAHRIITEGWGNPAWARAATQVGSTVPMIIITICAMGLSMLIVKVGRGSAAALIGLSPALAAGVTAFAKQSVHRIRPDLIPDGPQVGAWSWPSGHASGTMALALAVAWVLIASTRASRTSRFIAAAVVIAWSLIIGLTRVLIDVHWTSDVISGWITGIAAAVTALLIVQMVSSSAQARSEL